MSPRTRLAGSSAGPRQSLLKNCEDAVEHIHLDRCQLPLQGLDALLSFDIRAVVLISLMAITLGLTVLTDHDERSGVGCLKRQGQIKQDEGVRVPVAYPRDDVAVP